MIGQEKSCNKAGNKFCFSYHKPFLSISSIVAPTHIAAKDLHNCNPYPRFSLNWLIQWVSPFFIWCRLQRIVILFYFSMFRYSASLSLFQLLFSNAKYFNFVIWGLVCSFLFFLPSPAHLFGSVHFRDSSRWYRSLLIFLLIFMHAISGGTFSPL